jgi:hypothetical protein
MSFPALVAARWEEALGRRQRLTARLDRQLRASSEAGRNVRKGRIVGTLEGHSHRGLSREGNGWHAVVGT